MGLFISDGLFVGQSVWHWFSMNRNPVEQPEQFDGEEQSVHPKGQVPAVVSSFS